MVITVQCSSCATSFPVDTAKIPEGGVNARCSACKAIFRVERPGEHPDTIGVEEEAPFAAPVPPSEPMPTVGVEEEEGLSELESWEEPPAEPVSATEEEPGAEAAEEEVVVEAFDATAAVDEKAADAPDEHEWAIEMQEDLDASSLEVTPMETVESTVEETRDMMSEDSFSWEPAGFETSEDVMEQATQGEAEEQTEEEQAPEATAFEEPGETTFEAPEEREPEPPAPEPQPAAPPPTGFAFGHRDPHDKARRLARVLVSDMIMYNPDRHARALAGGTLKADFEDEIQKSWKEYVDQVGEEIANGTTYWPDALNDILAKGEQVF